ncbi:hypothetical protein B566_EDAN005589 [Ephemera danica]|nr:hypothetical protein B566_EDAN005589 [Ephemera danica]
MQAFAYLNFLSQQCVTCADNSGYKCEGCDAGYTESAIMRLLWTSCWFLVGFCSVATTAFPRHERQAEPSKLFAADFVQFANEPLVNEPHS